MLTLVRRNKLRKAHNYQLTRPMFRITYRYILKEMLLIFAISLLTFTFVLLVAKIFTLTDLVVNKGVSPGILVRLIGYKLPYILVYAFPMSTLMAVLITFLRLSGDSEITALKACGVSLYQLLPPALVLSTIASLFTGYMAVYAMPEGNRAFKEIVYRLGRQKAYVGIRPRIFNDDFKGLVLYVNNVDTSGRELGGVFISDERDPRLSHAIVARKAIVLGDGRQKALGLRLIDGEIHYDSKDLKSSDTVRFKTYELTLNLPQLGKHGGAIEPGNSEMGLKQLWQKIRTAEVKDAKYNVMVMELQEKFSIPFSCLILGVVGMSLGVKTKSNGYSAGVATALAIFLVYYVLLSACRSFGECGTLPPALGAWIPNLLLGSLSVAMFVKASRETPFKSLLVLDRLAKKIRLFIEARAGYR